MARRLQPVVWHPSGDSHSSQKLSLLLGSSMHAVPRTAGVSVTACFVVLSHDMLLNEIYADMGGNDSNIPSRSKNTDY